MYYRFAAADVASPAFRSRAISFVMAGGVAAAFLCPWNASAGADLIAGVPSGGPYLVIAILALLAISLLIQLRVPPSGEPHPGETSRPMATIALQPGFLVAVLAAAVGYAIMVLLGIGCNFLFVGGSTLLSSSHTEVERR